MVDYDKYWVKMWEQKENIKGVALENKIGQEKST